jgi:hypothetical protein
MGVHPRGRWMHCGRATRQWKKLAKLAAANSTAAENGVTGASGECKTAADALRIKNSQ